MQRRKEKVSAQQISNWHDNANTGAKDRRREREKSKKIKWKLKRKAQRKM
jgi:hypothetical protein